MTAQLLRGDVAVLVPAAGSGALDGRGGSTALRALAGEPLLMHAVRRLAGASSVGQVVVAAPPDAVDQVDELLKAVAPVTVVPGGPTRQASLRAALAAAVPAFQIILVHDVARALAPAALVERVVAAVRDGHDVVVPVLPVIDTVKQVDADGRVSGTVDRSRLRVVQTPQGFRREVLAAAHAAAVDDHTDDAGMAEKIGATVWTVPGDEAALKITHPLDLRIAELLLLRSV